METPAEVMVYLDQLAGEPRRARLLAISPHGFYEVNLQTPAGPRRALLPVERTFVVATEVEEAGPPPMEIER
jgi:hypothetical protein